ncbi:iron ABC transporter permease [Aquibacillus koreensis]|uniref:Iron ABC transporter permease n=1 Tax=Aquibacillus koreensis TaxID=279446 RepID=A0A9X4AHV5_9BACI|nr:iron ABC transporter permease [Aquibacillus koreensis]MCT2536047.1 iron ABC transporter permease [Aquibacillus koreensis]MDC3420502.1 iron ABC transporter permease [Aquibacillus koreensis]
MASFVKNNWVKTVLTFLGGTVLLFFLLFIHINQGSVDLSPSVVLQAIFAPQDLLEHHTVRYLRLPRAVIGILAGGALAVSGVILQTITKNPLSSSSTLGIHAGSYFAVVFATIFMPVSLQLNGLIVAFIGGVLTAALVFGLAGVTSSNPVKMVLAGMVVTIMFSSFTSLLQIFYENETAGLFLWGSGTLVQNNWNGVQFSLPFIVLGMLAAILLAKQLDIFRLGEDVASSLGQNISRLRLVSLLVAVFLTAVTVSVVGPIGFVGLIAPHLLKLLGFQNHYLLLIGSFIWGANVLLGADVLARIIDPSFSELPVGAITAFIGAPWLIFLILRKQNQRYGEKGSAMLVGNMRLPFSSTVVMVLLSVALLGLIIVGASTGNSGIQVMKSFQAVFGTSDDFIRKMILDIRLPRIIVAGFSGALLAISGYIFQGVLRNPLADPSVIGITSGAGVGALLVLYVSGLSAVFVPLGAFAGAIVAFFIVMGLSYRAKFQPTILALLGVGISAFGSAVIQILVVEADMSVASALTWLSGTTYAKSWNELFNYLLWPMIIIIPILYFQIRNIETLSLGDDTAMGLGMRVMSTRFVLALIASLVAAASVAAVGTIGFVGLMAPHLARMLLGPAHRHLLPTTALLGAVLLVIADILSRTLIVPKEIPSGIIVALIGAPYFLYIMYRSNQIKK